MFNKISKFSTKRPKLIIFIVILLIIIGASLGYKATSVLKTGGFDDPNAQSTIAQNYINSHFSSQQNFIIVVQSKHGYVTSKNGLNFGKKVSKALINTGKANSVESYWQNYQFGLISKNERYGLIVANIPGSEATAANKANFIANKLSINNKNFSIKFGGLSYVNYQITNEVNKSLTKTESIAVPLTLILLLLAFGTLTAALIPLILAGVTIVLTFAELYIFGSNFNVSIYAINLTTALGLGLAVDYSLFIVSRYREEIHNKKSIDEAISITLNTAGRTIAFSALTVSAALASMLVFPLYFLRSFAYAGVGVVLFAALTAIIVLPAILKLLGPRLESGRMPWHQRSYRIETSFWRKLANKVTRHPLITSVPVIVFLVILAIPFRNITFSTPDDRVLPNSSMSQQVGEITRTQFAANPDDQLSVVLKSKSATKSAINNAINISKLKGVLNVNYGGLVFIKGKIIKINDKLNNNGEFALLSVSTIDDYQSAQMKNLVSEIRYINKSNITKLYVDGRGPELIDSKKSIGSKLPLDVAIIAITTFVVLFLFSGSIVQPLRALVTNTLTLSAAFGVIVWIFEYGHLSSFLNFIPQPINISMPILLFSIAFGLSMDYEVFLLSRIKEQHELGQTTDEAVSHGLARAGRIVSTAAAILAVTFFAFSVSSISFLQLFGIGTGVAIILDATLVRGVLVPAFMHLMQENSWYAPKFLKKVTRNINIKDEDY